MTIPPEKVGESPFTSSLPYTSTTKHALTQPSDSFSCEHGLVLKGEWKVEESNDSTTVYSQGVAVVSSESITASQNQSTETSKTSILTTNDDNIDENNNNNNRKILFSNDTIQTQPFQEPSSKPPETAQWTTALRKLRRTAGWIVDSKHFQKFIVILILINAAMMGIATFDFVQDNPDASNAFDLVDKIFLIIFTIELGLQFIYRDFRLFLDGWLLFDFAIVIMSWSLESLQIVRTLRIFRALRLVTRVKVLKNLVSALFSVGPRIFAIFCLLVLIFYIYAVMCTELFKNLYKDGYTEFDYFSRLDHSLWTLLTMMTLEWGGISREVMAVYGWSWPIFVTFVMITSFIAYNLIVAVVCDSVSIIEKNSKQEELLEESDGLSSQESELSKVRRLQARVAELIKQQQQLLQAFQDGDSDINLPVDFSLNEG